MKEIEELLEGYSPQVAEEARLREWERSLWSREWKVRVRMGLVWFLIALSGAILAMNLAAVRWWGQ